MFPVMGGFPRRRFAEPQFIAALPRPGAGREWPSAWRDLVQALPWLLVVLIGWIANWSVEEIATLVALLLGSRALPAATAQAASHGK